MYTLIAEAGSTKIDWALVGKGGAEPLRFSTPGLNPMLASKSEVEDRLLLAVDRLNGKETEVEKVRWFGAGCATTDVCRSFSEELSLYFRKAEVQVSSDLEGAAIALFGNEEGVACILGTGSNSGHYDGHKITGNVASLGYVLGDEGSGSAIGKRIVRDALRGELPKTFADVLTRDYGVTKEEVLRRVYRESSPNKWLASLAKVAAEYMDEPAVRSILIEELSRFFTNCLDLYPGARSLHIGFVGGIATHFGDLLKLVAASMDYRHLTIVDSPIDRLIEYYENN